MSNIGNITYSTPTPPASSTGNNSVGGLTQQDFLQLMVAQFQASDPLADDSSGGSGGSGSGAADYVNQLMSMTNLTTMQTMSAQQGLLMAQNLPGQTVTITKPDNTTVSGVVTGTTIGSSGVNVTVGGNTYPATEITALTPTPTTAATTTSTSN